MKYPMNHDSSSRRDFLKTSAAGLGAAAILTPGAYAAGDEVLKVGLVGCGGRGTGAAKQALSADPKVKLTAMCDVFMDRLQESLGQLKNIKTIAGKIDVAPDHCFDGF